MSTQTHISTKFANSIKKGDGVLRAVGPANILVATKVTSVIDLLDRINIRVDGWDQLLDKDDQVLVIERT